MPSKKTNGRQINHQRNTETNAESKTNVKTITETKSAEQTTNDLTLTHLTLTDVEAECRYSFCLFCQNRGEGTGKEDCEKKGEEESKTKKGTTRTTRKRGKRESKREGSEKESEGEESKKSKKAAEPTEETISGLALPCEWCKLNICNTQLLEGEYLNFKQIIEEHDIPDTLAQGPDVNNN